MLVNGGDGVTLFLRQVGHRGHRVKRALVPAVCVALVQDFLDDLVSMWYPVPAAQLA